MEISGPTASGDWTVLAVAGRIDAASASHLERVCRAELRDRVALAIDLGEVDFMGSAGLRVLVALAQELGPHHGRLALVNPQSLVRDALDISGLARFLPVVSTLGDLAPH